TVVWPKGTTRKELNVALPRAVKVRGKVTEATSGQPVAGARVDYWSKSVQYPEGALPPAPARTAADGTFEIVVPAGKGHLLINATAGNFVREPIGVEELSNERLENPKPAEEAEPKTEGKPSFYPDGWVALDVKPGSKPEEVKAALRRKPTK